MYSYKSKVNHSSARLEDTNVSYKDLCAVCANVRGMPVQQAISFLSLAVDMRIPVYYPSWNKKLGARHELGGKKGRYPKKAAKIVMKVLKSAVANADTKGLDPDSLFIAHIAANKKNKYLRYSPKGRRNISALTTARVEVVLEELQMSEIVGKEKKKSQKERVAQTNVTTNINDEKKNEENK